MSSSRPPPIDSSLSASLRYEGAWSDHAAAAETQLGGWTYRFALEQRSIPDTRLQVSVSSGLRLPSLYELFAACARESGVRVATGRFGAEMQVELVNDGPVTFLLELRP